MSRPPAKGKGIGGPAKGEGRGGKRAENWTPEQAKVMSAKAVAARQSRAEEARAAREAWKAENPGAMSPKQYRGYIASGLKPVIDTVFDDALDLENPTRAVAQKLLIEQGIGRAPQEITGKDGAPLVAVSEERLLRELVAMAAELGLPVVIDGEGEEVDG